jgi:signal transduction histidine kinase
VSQTVNTKTLYALVLAGALFALALIGTCWTIIQLRDAQTWVEHTHQVIMNCKDLLLRTVDVETGQRGFIATGNKQFLQPVSTSRPYVLAHADKLLELTRDDPEEQARMAEIKKLTDAKISYIDKVLNTARQDRLKGALVMNDMQGKKLMDAIRALIAQSQAHQGDLLAAREASVNTLQNIVGLLIVVFSILEAFSLFYIYKITNEFTAEQKQKREALEAEIALRKATEQSLRETSVYLSRSNQDLQQFAYVASHDLQEPLRAVQGFTTLLAKTYKGKLDDQADAWIAQTVSGAERMRTLINGLLQYARVESRGSELQPIDLNQVVADVISDLALVIEESSATVKIADKLPTIQGDATQLRLLFTNLIGNAIKYRSDKAPVVEVSSMHIEPNFQVVVEDNGIGFDMKHQDKIFVIFQRLHSRNQYEGTGIGLALCRRIVERHLGTITATSVPGTGSKFIMKFPVDTANMIGPREDKA